MKCIYCKGNMERKSVPFQIDRKGYHLMFNAVSAWKCSQCGEVYFEETEIDTIQEVLKSLDEQTEKLTVEA